MNGWAQLIADKILWCHVCDNMTIQTGDTYYYVTELERDEHNQERPVCHLHVDKGNYVG
jgi:hypothetical protein